MAEWAYMILVLGFDANNPSQGVAEQLSDKPIAPDFSIWIPILPQTVIVIG
jgi:hypothetical protein